MPNEDRVVACPHCGASRNVAVTTVLRPGDENLTLLFRGQLNRVVCSDCDEPFVLAVPLLYRDDEESFLVYQWPREENLDWSEMETHMASLAKRIFTEFGEGLAPPTCRLVTDRGAFIEKIALHQFGFDDRIVEYIKYQLFNNPNEEHRIDSVRSFLRFDFSNTNEEILAFLVIDRETGAAGAGAHLPMEIYRELAQACEPDSAMDEELNALFPGYFVSVDRLM